MVKYTKQGIYLALYYFDFFICLTAWAIDMLPLIVINYISDILRAYLYFQVREVYLMRNAVTLACAECKQRNYQTNKNKKNDPDRLEFNKYCKFCKKHTLHKETK